MAEDIYLIRHGLTESNKKKIYAGRSNENLSKEGIDNLLKIGEKLKKLKIEKILSSPIRRAIQTSEILNTFLKVTIKIEKDFEEMRLGPWEGLSEEQVAIKFPIEWKIWNSKPSELMLDGRETLKELQLRALRGIKDVTNNSDCSRILVVTHVALIRVLIIYYNNLSMDSYRKINIPNCAVYLLNNKDQNKKLIRVL